MLLATALIGRMGEEDLFTWAALFYSPETVSCPDFPHILQPQLLKGEFMHQVLNPRRRVYHFPSLLPQRALCPEPKVKSSIACRLVLN